MGKMGRAGAGAGIFDKLEPEPHKNGPAPQHWQRFLTFVEVYFSGTFLHDFLNRIHAVAAAAL
jgi:hypothetical protein